ncbi:hypothetical protein LN492_19695, partial [Clostridioides difficile]|nr:hypothetical protein [Clostridioides difficile]
AIYAALSFGETFDFYDFGVSIATGLNEFFANFDFKSLATTLNVWVDGLWEFISGFLSTISLGTAFDGIKDFFSEIELDTLTVIVGAIAWKLGAGVAIKKGLLALITSGIGKLVLNLTGVELKKVTFTGVAKAIGTGLKNALSGVSTKIGLVFEGLFSGLKFSEAIAGAFGGSASTITTVGT